VTLVLSTVLPFFLIVGIGWAAGRWKMLPDGSVAPLNAFVFRFAMPALVTRLLWNTSVDDIIDLRFIGGWLVTGLVLFAAGGWIARLVLGQTQGRFAIRGQGASVANVGFLGFPILLGLFGDAAAGPLGMVLIVDLMIMIPLSLFLLEAARGGTAGFGSVALRAISGSVKNPFFLSIVAGTTLSITGFPPPPPVESFLLFLGGAAGPTALFALGVYLAGNPAIERPLEASWITLAKLALHPLVAWLVLGAGFGVSGVSLSAAIMIAALPVASNVFVVAQEYGVAVKLASDSIMVSTICAVFTVSGIALLLV